MAAGKVRDSGIKKGVEHVQREKLLAGRDRKLNSFSLVACAATMAQLFHLNCRKKPSNTPRMVGYVGICEAARMLGVSISSLRRWEAPGNLKPEPTPVGHRRYDLAILRLNTFRAAPDAIRRTIAFARVSSHDQKDDPERQKQLLELFCARQG